MTPETFRDWLRERGCSFEQHPSRRGDGVASITVKHGGKTATIPEAASRKDLDPRDVMAVCDELGLDPTELPGPSSRV